MVVVGGSCDSRLMLATMNAGLPLVPGIAVLAMSCGVQPLVIASSTASRMAAGLGRRFAGSAFITMVVISVVIVLFLRGLLCY